MSHLEKMIWAAVTALIFSLIAIGMIITEGITEDSGPSIITAMAIGFGLAVYGGREAVRYGEEKDHDARKDLSVHRDFGELWKDDHGPSSETDALPPEEGPPAPGP